jgi:hypothetical protein
MCNVLYKILNLPYIYFIYLYCKQRRQLKTFLTQIGPALPLTSDQPVISFWKWIGWKNYEVPKNRNLESVSAKNKLFFSPTCTLPAGCTRWGRFFPSAAPWTIRHPPRGHRYTDRTLVLAFLWSLAQVRNVRCQSCISCGLTSETHAYVSGDSRTAAFVWTLNRRSRSMAQICSVSVINMRSCRSSWFFS